MPDARPGGILAVDLGTRTGWAYGHGDGAPLVPTWGVWRRADTDSDAVHAIRLQNALADMFELMQPRLLILAARVGMIQTSAYLLTGLAFVAEVEAERARVRCIKVAESSARKAVLGRGSFGPRDTKGRLVKGKSSEANKDAAMAWCERMGWDVPCHDVADALVLLAYQAEIEGRRRVAA